MTTSSRGFRQVAEPHNFTAPTTPVGPSPDGDRLERDAAKLFRELVRKKIEPEQVEIWLDDKLKRELDPKSAQTKKKMINEWRGAFVGSNRYTLFIDEATTNQNQGDNWRLTIYVNGTEVDQADFAKGAHAGDKRPSFTFNWKPGDTVRILLEGDPPWWPWRDDLIDKDYSGLYVPWEMHKDGQGLEQNGTSLKFEISPSPGPPREWSKPLPSPKKVKSQSR